MASSLILVLVNKAFLRKYLLKFPKLSAIYQYFEYNILFKYWIQTSLELLITSTYGLTLSTNSRTWPIIDFSFCIFIFVSPTQISQIATFSLSYILCTKRSKIINEDEKTKFESKFNVLFNELKENNFPLFYFLFFIRRLLLVMILNLIPSPIMKLTFSAILSLAVI